MLDSYDSECLSANFQATCDVNSACFLFFIAFCSLNWGLLRCTGKPYNILMSYVTSCGTFFFPPENDDQILIACSQDFEVLLYTLRCVRAEPSHFIPVKCLEKTSHSNTHNRLNLLRSFEEVTALKARKHILRRLWRVKFPNYDKKNNNLLRLSKIWLPQSMSTDQQNFVLLSHYSVVY